MYPRYGYNVRGENDVGGRYSFLGFLIGFDKSMSQLAVKCEVILSWQDYRRIRNYFINL